MFNRRKINVKDKQVTIEELAKICQKNLRESIRQFKRKICVICSNNVKDFQISEGNVLQLPCGCVICCKKCWNPYFELVFEKKKIKFVCKYNYLT